MGAMSEFAWATVSPRAVLGLSGPAESWPSSSAPLPELLDADADDAAELPRVPVRAAGDAEPLVAVSGDRLAVIAVYRQSGFPHAVSGAWLRARVLERLRRAAAALPDGFGLVVCDGWRDPQLQQFLYDRAYAHPGLPPGFVAPPSADPACPPPHSTGGTVDLTLSYQGRALALGTDFDEFTVRAFASALELDAEDLTADDVIARDLRRLLYAAMAGAGFVVLAREWWHFEYGTRLWAAVTGGEPLFHGARRPTGALGDE